MLDPFVPVLLDCFRTYHNPIVSTTLHVITLMSKYELPSFNQLCKKFLNKIFNLFKTQATT